MILLLDILVFVGLINVVFSDENPNNSTSVCSQERDMGTSCDGGDSGKKFYYNERMGVCQPFLYKGCEGNDNRFESSKECSKTCGSKSSGKTGGTPHKQWTSAEKCDAPHLIPDGQYIECKEGECPNGHQCKNKICCPTREYVCTLNDDSGSHASGINPHGRFVWVSSIKNCIKFSYFGAKGNYNNFASFAHCKLVVYATYFNSEIKVRTSAKRAEGVRSSKEMEEYKVLLVCKRDEVGNSGAVMTSQTCKIAYGTSGFRCEANLLLNKTGYSVATRVGFFAGYRARELGKKVGVMITASHNPINDNGIKLVDPFGEMLATEFENLLDVLINEFDDNAFNCLCNEYINEYRLNRDDPVETLVIVATDTRPSSHDLLTHIIKGLKLACAGAEIYEKHTTPQLHFLVRAANDPTFSGDMVSRFTDAFNALLELLPSVDKLHSYTPKLYVDCANGVGSLWVKKYLDLEDVISVNTDVESDKLNFNCGADFVKIDGKIPTGFENLPSGSRCASLDGDADRIIFFSIMGTSANILDGDHISALFCRVINDQYSTAEISGDPIPLTFGVVQTAYSNGSSTKYFKEKIGVEVITTRTGIKHLEIAARKFDIGVYFESNGHGTVAFSPNFHKFIQSFKDVPRHIKILHLFSRLVNEIIGDGIADIMAIEMILRYYDWSIQDWQNNTYKNLPSVARKVYVKDRSIYRSHAENETILMEPEYIQSEMDDLVKKYSNARAFIRPSGTEQLVRIYVEADSKKDAKDIADKLEFMVREHSK